MRQETGSNQSPQELKISVRLPSNGVSFIWDEVFPHVELDENTTVTIELLTKQSMLIPRQLIERDTSAATAAQRELARIGIVANRNEEIVRLAAEQEITALVVVPKELTNQVTRRYGENVNYSTPLLLQAAGDEPHILLDSHEEITTIKIFNANRELRFADTYETPTIASTLYWVQRVAAAHGLDKEQHLYIYRSNGMTQRLLKKNFNHIMVCE